MLSRFLSVFVVLCTAASASVAQNECPPNFILKWGSAGAAKGQFGDPLGIAVNSDGFVYVADNLNNRVQMFTPFGGFVLQWGFGGQPWDVAVDANEDVYVSSVAGHVVGKFSKYGYKITSWGTLGTGDGQFTFPRGVAFDSGGNVYVADSGNKRIQKFTSDGTFILKWGSFGSGNGQFEKPVDVAVDASDNVYVVDQSQNPAGNVQKFTSSGTFITRWGPFGVGDGELNQPGGIELDSQGNVYVADCNPRIVKFTNTGAYVGQWGSSGSGDGQFVCPPGLAIDFDDNIYVVEHVNDRVQKFAYTTILLFPPRSSTAADTTIPPGVPVFYDSVSVTLNHATGDSFYIAAGCVGQEPWIVDDKVYINGVDAGLGFDGDKGLGLPLGVPIDAILNPVPARNVTGFIPLGNQTMEFRLADTQREIYGNTAVYVVKIPSSIPTGVHQPNPSRTPRLLIRSHPNPFHNHTTITYRVPEPGPVSLRVYDVRGRLVKILANAPKIRGTHVVSWNGRNERNRPVATGIYFLQLTSSGEFISRKLVFLK